MSDKILVGRVEVKQTKFGGLTKLSFGPNDISKLQEQAQSNKGWVNLILKESKSGNLYLEVDTWKPTKQAAQAEDFPF